MENRVLGFRCFNCEKEWLFSQVTYNCPSCNENVDVIYDYAKIRKQFSLQDLKNNKCYDIWRYRFFYPVSVAHSLSLHIGWTPLYKSKKLEYPNLFLKDDGRNPSASFKDRASAIVLLSAMEKKATRIIGASTGNAGASMACLAANVGMPVTILLPDSAPKAKIAQLLVFGAKVIPIRGSYDDAFELCQKLALENNWYNRNTGYNPYTREGKKSCAFEICEQLDWNVPDWVFVSVGDGNIISGIWKGFCDLYECGFIDKLPRLCGVQSTKSNAIFQAFQNYQKKEKYAIASVVATTKADSISVDMPKDGLAALKAIVHSKGICIEVTDTEILCEISHCARDFAIFGEPAGVASVIGYKKSLLNDVISINEISVCVITGNGLKDVSAAISSVEEPKAILPEDVRKIL